jgi:Domain of unknown function (DUF5069)
MTNQPLCSDYVETSGINFFARMLDKIRLNAQGFLPDGYHLGFSDPTSFDARFCRFWEVDYDQLAARTLEGGSNEELLAWCFRGRKRPNEDQIWFGIRSLLSGAGGIAALPAWWSKRSSADLPTATTSRPMSTCMTPMKVEPLNMPPGSKANRRVC